ncbi:Eco57I restriction-modification methylase domain-containing protein, partial [Bacteroides xylanisolvens]
MVSIIDFYVLQKRPSKEGFDIVIGNPPYVNFANIKSA